MTLTRTQAIAIARDMDAGGWQQFQIRDYLASRGLTVHRTTIKRWVDDEYAARYNARHAADQRRSYRDLHKPSWFRVLDDEARARLAEVVGQSAPDAPPVFNADLMLALRVQDGLSYTAISKVAGRIYGVQINESQVRYRLHRLGAPKNLAKIRGSQNLKASKVTA